MKNPLKEGRVPLNVAWDPKTGVCAAERLGQRVTIEQLVEATGYSMDEVWVDPDRIEATAWPTSMKLEVRDEETGRIMKSQPIQVWNHRLKAFIRPNHGEVLSRALRDELLEQIRDEVQQHPRVPRQVKTQCEDEVMVELDIFDAHFQMLAWAPETGQNHDLDIITARYLDAARDLARRAVLASEKPVGKFLLVVGQDLFHTDKYLDGKVATTARGTAQDVDTRFAKAASMVRWVLTEIIEELLAYAPRVEVLVVPGNHDTERAWWIGEVLDARFHADPNVTVDNRPMSRKYVEFGRNLIGFSHGHNEKPKDLRDYMSQEARHAWARTVFREWHIGHWHHELVSDERGVLLRQMPSIASTDKWHFDQGFVHSQKGARAIVYDRWHGPVLVVQHNLPVTPRELAYTDPMFTE